MLVGTRVYNKVDGIINSTPEVPIRLTFFKQCRGVRVSFV